MRRGVGLSTFQGLDECIDTSALPEFVRAEVFGPISGYRGKIKQTGKEEEEAGDQRKGFEEVRHHLGGEQELQHAKGDEVVFVIEAWKTFLEERGWESSFREEENDDFDKIQGNYQKCPKDACSLVGDA